MKPASAKAKGSRLEREFARSVGGKRTPLSGATGGGDVTMPMGSIWADWSWEGKARAQLPVLLTSALAQAQMDIRIGDRRRPAAVLREDGGRIIVAFYWDDLRTWAEALAEMGQGSLVKRLARQAIRNLEEIERMA